MINPIDFAQLMAMSRGDRRDLLEFIGSTPLGSKEAGRLVGRVSAAVIDATRSRLVETRAN